MGVWQHVGPRDCPAEAAFRPLLEARLTAVPQPQIALVKSPHEPCNTRCPSLGSRTCPSCWPGCLEVLTEKLCAGGAAQAV